MRNNNFLISKGRSLLILILPFLFLLCFVSADTSKFGYNYLDNGKRVIVGGNYTINVNNSNYWQGHTGTDGSWLTGISTYNATYNTWAYNQTLDMSKIPWANDWMIAYSDNTGTKELTFNDANGKFLKSNGEAALTWDTPPTYNSSYVPYIGAANNVDLGYKNITTQGRIGIGAAANIYYPLYVENRIAGGAGLHVRTNTSNPGNPPFYFTDTARASDFEIWLDDTNAYIGPWANKGMGFSRNSGTQTMVIDNAGRVGIGKFTSLLYQLSVVNTGKTGMLITTAGGDAGNPPFYFTDTSYTSNLEFWLDNTNVNMGPYSNKGIQFVKNAGNDKTVVIDNGGKVGISTNAPSYPLEVNASVSGISIYAQANISATGYNTRTTVYDKTKGEALDYIKDANDYLTSKGAINHSKFYGYAGTTKIKDITKPVNISVMDNICSNGTKEQGGVCEKKLVNITIYPYNITEGQVSLNMEVDVLRQAVYELNQKLEAICLKQPDLC